MRRIILAALALLAAPAFAQTQQANTYRDTTGALREAQGTFCVPAKDGSGCAGGSGGGGDASAANQTAVQAAPGSNATKATAVQGIDGAKPVSVTIASVPTVAVSNFPATQPVSGTVTLGAGSAAIGTVGVTSLPALVAGTATIGSIANITGTVSLPTGAATSANQTTEAGYLANIQTSSAAGRDTGGRLLPGQGKAVGSDGSSAPAPVTMTASSAQQLSGAISGRVGLTITVEQALSAPIYLCSVVTTTCSATSHDAYIPGSAGDGSTWTYLFAPNSVIYYYTTGTPKVLAVNWIAQ